MVWSGVAAASAAISEQYHQRQPVRRKASDCRPRTGRVVRRRAINALVRFSGSADMFYHLHRIRAGRDVTARLVTALVLSRLDYCNAVLAGLPAFTVPASPARSGTHRSGSQAARPCDSGSPRVAIVASH